MTDLEAWQVVCKPIPLSTYKSARRKAMTWRVLLSLAALAVVSGALIALQPIYEAMK